MLVLPNFCHPCTTSGRGRMALGGQVERPKGFLPAPRLTEHYWDSGGRPPPRHRRGAFISTYGATMAPVTKDRLFWIAWALIIPALSGLAVLFLSA